MSGRAAGECQSGPYCGDLVAEEFRVAWVVGLGVDDLQAVCRWAVSGCTVSLQVHGLEVRYTGSRWKASTG
jgi:hypothetical protein